MGSHDTELGDECACDSCAASVPGHGGHAPLVIAIGGGRGACPLNPAPLISAPEALLRKGKPLASGCLDYFPDALLAVAELSRIGNEQHNPGQPLYWDRSKSSDEADALLRHLIDRGTVDTDGVRHSAKVAWRALALLQKELEDANRDYS